MSDFGKSRSVGHSWVHPKKRLKAPHPLFSIDMYDRSKLGIGNTHNDRYRTEGGNLESCLVLSSRSAVSYSAITDIVS
jgi:hypothetical protein